MMHASPAQQKLLGPAASALRPPQGSGQQQTHQQWLEAAAAQLPIPPPHEAPSGPGQPAGAPAAKDVQAALMRASLGLGMQQ